MRTYFELGNKPTLERISREILTRGGITVNWRNTRMERPSPSERFIVSLKGMERKILIGSDPDWRIIARAVNDYVGDLTPIDRFLDSGLWFGAWADLGVLYLDVSRTYMDRCDAVRAAKREDQIAYYDAEKNEAVSLFTKGPDGIPN